MSAQEKTLQDALRSNEFAVTAELALGPVDSLDDIASQAMALRASTDAVQIPDHFNARPHIPSVAVGAYLKSLGIDAVARVNCRDRNRIAVQSELLAARALGVRNLLLARGSDLPADHRPTATGVYDLTAIDLLRTAAAIRDGEALSTASPDDENKLFLGTVATAFKPNKRWEPEKLLAKADAGAQFIQLQLCMDIDILQSYMARLVEAKLTWRFQVLANIAVLPSVEMARDLRGNNVGALIPSSLLARLEQARDPEAEGVAITAEFLQLLKDTPGIAGANLQTTGNVDLIVAAIRESGVGRSVAS